MIRLTTSAAKYQPDDYHIVDISILALVVLRYRVCVCGGGTDIRFTGLNVIFT